MAQTALSPYELLRELDARSRQNAFGLPQQSEVKQTWDGIGFRLNKGSFVVAMNEVRELLPMPSYTRIPGAKSWVRGIANVRGNLLPIIDLRELLSGETGKPTARTRVMVIQQDGVLAGLQVDEVMGMRHFFEEEYSLNLPEVGDAVANLLLGSYRRGSDVWGVFSMEKLVQNDEFMKVAA